MKHKTKVAIVKSNPEAIHGDIDRIMKQAEIDRSLPKGSTTILKDNISGCTTLPNDSSAGSLCTKIAPCWTAKATIMAEPFEVLNREMISSMKKLPFFRCRPSL